MPEVLKSHLKEGLRIIVRAPGHDGKAGVVLSEKADKGKVPVRLSNGTTIELKRTEMEPDTSPAPPPLKKTAMKKGKKATKIFLVDSGDKHARQAFARDVEGMGGELVEEEGEDTLSVWCGDPDEGLIGYAKTSQPLYSCKLILDCAAAGELPDPFQYMLRDKPGTVPPPAGARAPYTVAEDQNILAFCERELARDPTLGLKGDNVWKRAVQEKVTGRSWQAMKERYKKVLIVKLHEKMSDKIKKATKAVGEQAEDIDDDDDDEEEKVDAAKSSPVGRKRKAAVPVVKKEKGAEEGIDLVTPPRGAKRATRQAVKEEVKEEEEEEEEEGERSEEEESEEGEEVDREAERARQQLVNSEVERLISETGWTKKQVIYSLIVCGGDVGLAELYLKKELSKEEIEELWKYDDDAILVAQEDMMEIFEPGQPTEEEIKAQASDSFMELVTRKGVESVRERYLWIHAPH